MTHDTDAVTGQYYGLLMMHHPSSPTTDTARADLQRKSTVVRVSFVV